MKFKKICIMEPSNMFPETLTELQKLAAVVESYNDIPKDEDEIIRRIGDADAVILSYTSNITKRTLDSCPNIRYIGLSCTLYSPKSCNVDLITCQEKGITVTGISNYGEEGVVEFVVSELIQLFHNYGDYNFEDYPREITGINIGIVGLGSVGTKIAKAMMHFGGNVHYFDLARKPEVEAEGLQYLPMEELLKTCTVICTCLSKNIVAMKEPEFKLYGTHKVLFNTGLSPTFDIDAVKNWLSKGDTHLICDSEMALGDLTLLDYSTVSCKHAASGGTTQCLERLNQKVLANIQSF